MDIFNALFLSHLSVLFTFGYNLNFILIIFFFQIFCLLKEQKYLFGESLFSSYPVSAKDCLYNQYVQLCTIKMCIRESANRYVRNIAYKQIYSNTKITWNTPQECVTTTMYVCVCVCVCMCVCVYIYIYIYTFINHHLYFAYREIYSF